MPELADQARQELGGKLQGWIQQANLLYEAGQGSGHFRDLPNQKTPHIAYCRHRRRPYLATAMDQRGPDDLAANADTWTHLHLEDRIDSRVPCMKITALLLCAVRSLPPIPGRQMTIQLFSCARSTASPRQQTTWIWPLNSQRVSSIVDRGQVITDATPIVELDPAKARLDLGRP